MRNIIYHVRKREDVVQEGLKMKLTGAKKGAHVGLLSCYNLHVDAGLGVGHVFLVPALPARNTGKGPGNPVFNQRTNHAFNRIRHASTGQFLKGRTTG